MEEFNFRMKVKLWLIRVCIHNNRSVYTTALLPTGLFLAQFLKENVNVPQILPE